MKVIARDRLILALDVPSSLEAERLMDQVQDQITFVKVDSNSTLRRVLTWFNV